MAEEQLQPQPKSGTSKCLIGCLAAGGIFLLVLIVGGVVVYRNARGWAADAFHQGMQQTVEGSDLPADQKQGIMTEVTTLRDDFKSGRIGLQELARVMQELQDSPLMPLMMVWAVNAQHVATSGLSPEEKQDADLQAQRFARGVIEEKISEDAAEEVIRPVMEPASDPNAPQPKETLTDEEVRAFVASLKSRADAAAIPNEPYQPDIAREVKRVIDKGLNRASGTTPQPPPAPPVAEPPPAEAPVTTE